jgi:hypothetical protein
MHEGYRHRCYADDVPAPLDAVSRLERRLRGTDLIGFFVRLRSDGKLSANLEGGVELRPTGQAMIELHGDLGSVPTKLVSTEGGDELIVESGDRDVVIDAPESMRDRVATGLVRVGLLDTVVRMLGRSLEGHMNTELRWITDIDAEPSRPDLGDCTGYAFSVHEGRGYEIATATLWIERDSGLPRERSQSMHVISATSTEQYWGFYDERED